MKIKNSYKKVLIINIFGIGDVLFTTPLIRNIKNFNKDVFIGYICNNRTVDVLENNPCINKVFVYEKDDFINLSKKSKFQLVRKIFSFLKEIKDEKFDLVIDVSLNKYSSFFLWLAGIKERVGFNYKNRSPFLTKKINLIGYEKKHVVDFYLDFLRQIGIPNKEQKLEFFISPEDIRWAENFFKENNLKPSDKIIAIVPGGGASWGKDAFYKRWPVENYAKLADKVVEKSLGKIILLSGPSEKEICLSVAKEMKTPSLNVGGKTTVGQFAALLSKSHLAIVNDGGPLHVAVAVGVQTVSIFGPVDENVYGPFPRANHVVVSKNIACRPCYWRFRVSDCQHYSCLKTLGVEEVIKKIEEIL